MRRNLLKFWMHTPVVMAAVFILAAVGSLGWAIWQFFHGNWRDALMFLLFGDLCLRYAREERERFDKEELARGEAS